MISIKNLVSRIPKKSATRSGFRLASSKVTSMQQVDVDDPALQANMGKINMGLIRKAEKKNATRAEKFVVQRKKNVGLGGVLVGMAFVIYIYTFWAMKQETFLDDFELPAPDVDDEEPAKK